METYKPKEVYQAKPKKGIGKKICAGIAGLVMLVTTATNCDKMGEKLLQPLQPAMNEAEADAVTGEVAAGLVTGVNEGDILSYKLNYNLGQLCDLVIESTNGPGGYKYFSFDTSGKGATLDAAKKNDLVNNFFIGYDHVNVQEGVNGRDYENSKKNLEQAILQKKAAGWPGAEGRVAKEW